MKIRKITREDEAVFREFRLSALRESPAAFGSDFESEAALPLGKICRGLKPEGEFREAFVLGAWSEHGALIGMAGFNASQRPKIRHKGLIWGIYVALEHRGKGVGRELFASVLDRSKDLEELEQIHLSVVASNEGARRLYESFGFTEYGREPSSLKVDGIDHDQCLMVLKIGDIP